MRRGRGCKCRKPGRGGGPKEQRRVLICTLALVRPLETLVHVTLRLVPRFLQQAPFAEEVLGRRALPGGDVVEGLLAESPGEQSPLCGILAQKVLVDRPVRLVPAQQLAARGGSGHDEGGQRGDPVGQLVAVRGARGRSGGCGRVPD
jgi:hypothetical protein